MDSEKDARGPIPPALKRFVWDIQSMVELDEGERAILMIGRDLMARYLASDEALPEPFAGAGAFAVQYQVYSDAMARFCVVSTVLPTGAALSIAQPGLWEIMGVLSGAVERQLEGANDGQMLQPGLVETRRSGETSLRISNARNDQPAITLHVYGGDLDGLTRRLASTNENSGFGNDETAPPYDIFSIQTEIRD